jgi:hypothetical protein
VSVSWLVGLVFVAWFLSRLRGQRAGVPMPEEVAPERDDDESATDAEAQDERDVDLVEGEDEAPETEEDDEAEDEERAPLESMPLPVARTREPSFPPLAAFSPLPPLAPLAVTTHRTPAASELDRANATDERPHHQHGRARPRSEAGELPVVHVRVSRVSANPADTRELAPLPPLPALAPLAPIGTRPVL